MTTSSTPIRILVADDHPIVREGLVAILSTQPDFSVVGQAATGSEVVRMVTELRPDVLLLDLEMPDMDGVEALHRLRDAHVPVRVIVFTAFDTDERSLGAVRAGAQGYLLKGVPRDEVFQAIRVVHAGNSLLQPIVASRLLRQVSEENTSTVTGIHALTARELDVLRLLRQDFHQDDMRGEVVAHSRVEAQRAGPDRFELGRGDAVAAGEQRDVVAERDQLVAQIGDDPFGAAVKLGRHGFHQRGDLGDLHVTLALAVR